MIRYIITIHRPSSGANLSRVGVFGNVPYTSVAAARAGAEIDAAGSPFSVSLERTRHPIPEPKA